MKTKQLPKLGNIWTAKARIQKMQDDGIAYRWVTLATCMDTPNAIRAAAQRLTKNGYEMNKLWVVGDATSRKMVSDL